MTPVGALPSLMEQHRCTWARTSRSAVPRIRPAPLSFGTDPRSSVLDTTCKAHEIDNLYATDAGFFPSIGAVNPTLTIIANALRVADHLRERLGATDAPKAEATRGNSHVLGGTVLQPVPA